MNWYAITVSDPNGQPSEQLGPHTEHLVPAHSLDDAVSTVNVNLKPERIIRAQCVERDCVPYEVRSKWQVWN